MKFKTITLGCKVNQYESQYVRTVLLANDYMEYEPGDENQPGLIFINTCSVTGESDAKSRKLISHTLREYPNAELVIMGCYATQDPQKIMAFPRVRAILTDKRKLQNLLSDLGFTNLPTVIQDFNERHRAYVKIQDGCRVGCAYCIIPTVRSVLQSRTMEEILAEIQCLADHQYREFILTGIHLGHYGLDFYTTHPDKNLTLENYVSNRINNPVQNRPNLARLLQFLMQSEFPGRIRLGSLEAVEVSDALLTVMEKNQKRICPHFHLSMQSGDDTVLKNMRRRWTCGQYIQKCEEIHHRIPHAFFTTDIIVGFPGETAEQFERTCSVVKQLRFSKVHLFRFSPRPGTIASTMPNQIPESIKKVRLARLESIANRLRLDIARDLKGQHTVVLIEGWMDDDNAIPICYGTSESYFSVHIFTHGIHLQPGELVEVQITGNNGDILEGIPVDG